MFCEKRSWLEGLSRRKDLKFMRSVGLIGVLSLSVFLLGCSPNITDVSTPISGASGERAEDQLLLGQVLPISAEVQIDSELIELEVASTPDERSTGLMYRTELPPNRGMLFVFEFPRIVQAWMLNTRIQLDMVFLLDSEVKDIVANVPPCEVQFCPTYSSRVKVNQMIELAGGRAAELGLRVGDRLDIRFLDTPRPAESAP
jgi:uncharacterized membrane protein (UPF0127 family)